MPWRPYSLTVNKSVRPIVFGSNVWPPSNSISCKNISFSIVNNDVKSSAFERNLKEYETLQLEAARLMRDAQRVHMENAVLEQVIGFFTYAVLLRWNGTLIIKISLKEELPSEFKLFCFFWRKLRSSFIHFYCLSSYLIYE